MMCLVKIISSFVTNAEVLYICIFRRLKSIGKLPPSIMIYLFYSLVSSPVSKLLKPLEVQQNCRKRFLNGFHSINSKSVGGVSTACTAAIDKVFMWYLRCILTVKATTSNLMVLGECGSPPPSVTCHISTLCYYKRLYNMYDGNITKQVFNELCRLNSHGFKN